MKWDQVLSKEEAIQALQRAEFKVVEKPDVGFGPEAETQILFNGVWLCLCRTDFKDDVCTSEVMAVEEAKTRLPTVGKKFQEKVWFGARVNGENFAVIDAMTDG